VTKLIYRLITVREGEQALILPTFQAMVRQLGRLALKGNGPALRTYFGIVQAIEQRVAMQAAVEAADKPPTPKATDRERAEALMAILRKARLQDQ
jgi:hypothetical protein